MRCSGGWMGCACAYRVFVIAVVLLLAVGCATVPITGRRQLAIIPGREIVGLGTQQYREILAQSTLSTDATQVERVRMIGGRIARAAEVFYREKGQAAELRHFSWEFNLIQDDKTVNAFCLPGGKVAIYSGILPVAGDDAGLATVIAHEIAHALAHHGSERLSQMMLAQFGGVVLDQATAKGKQQTREFLLLAYGVGMNIGVVLPYSRLHEKEADYIGLILMARAGYDPEAAVAFWERMSRLAGSRTWEFLSTHPAPATRIEDLRQALPEARKEFRRP